MDPSAATQTSALLKALPDDPMHVEVRGLLMCRADVQLLHDPAAPTADGFLFAPAHGLAIGYGAPPVGLLPELRSLADRSGMTGQDIELHLPDAAAESWLGHDRVRSLGQNHVQTLPTQESVERIHDLVAKEADVITDPSDSRLKTLPTALELEFAALCPWPVVVAIAAQDRIASIAYAFVETEGYFDISIDTVHPFRREGYGVSCAAALIRQQLHRGKRPVWIANEKNPASLALSSKLGFEDVGHVQRALLG